MSYTAMYRRFRPTTFEEVKGQDAIVTTLKTKSGRIVSVMPIYSAVQEVPVKRVLRSFCKSVNCEHPVDGSPCGECASCKAIAEGRSMNVIEIDAASNNGVDNIREIVNEVAYSPTEGKYRVYIIDEVHMLSAGAFNALLKPWRSRRPTSSLFWRRRKPIKFRLRFCPAVSVMISNA